MSGFAAISRGMLDHPLFEGDSARAGAWLWMVLRACWKPTPYDVGGKIITLERGQLCASRAQMAKAWGWSPSAVERFLTRLQTEQMIGRETGQGKSVITICNYAKYQDISEQTGQAPEQATGQRPDSDRTTKEPLNKITKEEASYEANARGASAKPEKPDPFPCPDGVDPLDWSSLLAARKAKRSPINAGAYRQIVRKLGEWAEDGWPPGPIVANAVERGWTTVFETDEMKAPKNGRQPYPQRPAEHPELGKTGAAFAAINAMLGDRPGDGTRQGRGPQEAGGMRNVTPAPDDGRPASRALPLAGPLRATGHDG